MPQCLCPIFISFLYKYNYFFHLKIALKKRWWIIVFGGWLIWWLKHLYSASPLCQYSAMLPRYTFMLACHSQPKQWVTLLSLFITVNTMTFLCELESRISQKLSRHRRASFHAPARCTYIMILIWGDWRRLSESRSRPRSAGHYYGRRHERDDFYEFRLIWRGWRELPDGKKDTQALMAQAKASRRPTPKMASTPPAMHRLPPAHARTPLALQYTSNIRLI